jgi:hypothetical protein
MYLDGSLAMIFTDALDRQPEYGDSHRTVGPPRFGGIPPWSVMPLLSEYSEYIERRILCLG